MMAGTTSQAVLAAVLLASGGGCAHVGHLLEGAARGLGHAAEASGKAVAQAASSAAKATAGVAKGAGKATAAAAKSAAKAATTPQAASGKAASGAAAGVALGKAAAVATAGAGHVAAAAGGAGARDAARAAAGAAKTPVAGPIKHPGSTPIAGPIKPRPPHPAPSPTPAVGIAIAPSAWGGHFGGGSAFFWDVGVAYRPDHSGEEATGPAHAGEATVALLGAPPAPGAAEPRSTRSTLLEMIGDALSTVDLAAPGLGDTAAVEPLLWALQEAAERGARVRVLVDEHAQGTAIARLQGLRGVEVRRPQGQLAAALGAGFLVIDRGEACLAGEAFRGNQAGPELALLLRAPASVRALEDVFEADWAQAAGRAGPGALPPAGGYRFPEEATAAAELAASAQAARLALQPVFTPRGRLPSEALWAEPALVSLIDSAQSALVVRVAGAASIDAPIAQALQRATARGVHLRVLAESPAPGIAAAQQRKARVSPGAPSLVAADGKRLYLCSGALSARAMSVERNAGLLIEGEAVAAAAVRFFEEAWADAAGTLASR